MIGLGFPHALWLLLAVPALLWLVAREAHQRRRRLARLGDAGLLAGLSVGASERRRLALRLCGVVAWASLVLALAGPQWGERTELLPRRGLDVVFALDLSHSMRARDVRPDRLERAKAEVDLVLRRLGEHRVGLVTFAGTAFVQCPLTTDVEAVRAFLRAADPTHIPQGGTDLGAGLEVARNLFLAEEEADPKAAEAGRLLVVVTDGEDHEGGIDKPAAELRQMGVEVLLIGVGGDFGEPIPVTDGEGRVVGYKKDRQGETIMTRMSAEALERVAAATGGRFLDGGSAPDLGMSEVEAAVSGLEKRELESRVKRTGVDRSSWPLGLALLLLAFAALPERGRRRTPGRAAPIVTSFALVLVATSASAQQSLMQRTEPHLKEGAAALSRGSPDEAIERFRAARADDPDEKATVEYDVGQALLEQARQEAQAAEGDVDPEAPPPGSERYGEAAGAFERAFSLARSAALKGEAALAQGNAWARAGELEKAVEGYRKAVVAAPDDARPQRNLRAALEALRAAPPPPPEEGEGDDEEQEGDEEQEQEPGEGSDEGESDDQQEGGESSPDEDDQGSGQDPDKQQPQQDPQEQEGDPQQGDKREDDPHEDGEDKQPAPGDKPQEPPADPSKGSTAEQRSAQDVAKEKAEQLLDALRSRERPLSPLLMDPERQKRSAPPERDW